MNDAPEPVSVFISMPCYGGIAPEFVDSLLNLQRHLLRLGVEHVIDFLPGESLITRARNRCVWKFLNESKCTHLLFLDVDLIFSPTAIMRLLGSGYDVCAAPYAKKKEGDGLVGNWRPKDGTFRKLASGQEVGEPEEDRDGWVKALDVGTGCMVVSRRAFERLIATKMPHSVRRNIAALLAAEIPPDIRSALQSARVWAEGNAPDEPAIVPYTSDFGDGQKLYPFFHCGPEDERDENSRYLSEDYYFSRLWQVVGDGDIWMDTRAKVAHVGRKAYVAPSMGEQLRAGKEKAA